MVKISYSVGKNGINKYSDVMKIQGFIKKNLHLIKKIKRLKEDGRAGRFTMNAIVLYQKNVVKMSKPDSRVDPSGKTLIKLNRTAKASIRYIIFKKDSVCSKVCKQKVPSPSVYCHSTGCFRVRLGETCKK
jgi:hypothetical protein